MNPQMWWYLSRATGIVAYLMLTASVLWGIALAARVFAAKKRPWLLDLHRWLGGLTMFFLGFHLLSLVADSSVKFGLADLLVPFAASWNPVAVALGIFALWLLVAVETTSLAVKRLSRNLWRGVHLFSYAAFWLTSIHGALAGTDSSRGLYVAVSVLAVSAVVAAALHRVQLRGKSAGRTVTDG
jgi:methionine sulfoxide reductase heme-binding subunit